QGLHAGVHHRAWRGGPDQAGIRPSLRQGHRAERRSARRPPGVGGRHRRDTRPGAELPNDRRPRPCRERLYGMIHPNVSDTTTVRSVFVIGPDKKVKLTITYPQSTGRNFDEILRVIDSMQLTASHKVSTPVNWKQGEDVIIIPAVSDDEARQRFRDG